MPAMWTEDVYLWIYDDDKRPSGSTSSCKETTCRKLRKNNIMSINYLREVTDPTAKERALKSASVTFSISSEDHTLGNALRSMLSSKMCVDFAGYSIPHPTQTEMNFRLQTVAGRPALETFAEALDDLAKMAGHVQETFEQSMVAHMGDS